MPPAPPAFSTITDAPRFSAMRGPIIRPKISLPLPVANGTTMVSGRAGQSWAAAGAVAAVSSTTNAEMSVTMAAIILMAGMVPPVILKIPVTRASVRGDVGRLDDRPPLLDLGLLVGGQRLGGLLVARRDFLAEIGKLLPHFRIGQRLHDRGIEPGDDLFRGAFGGPDRVPQ